MTWTDQITRLATELRAVADSLDDLAVWAEKEAQQEIPPAILAWFDQSLAWFANVRKALQEVR